MNTNICLIDDDKTSNYITSLVIDKYFPGLAKICFAQSFHALEFLKGIMDDNDKLPEYIFLDIEMPQINAWQFLQELDELKIDPNYESKIFLLSVSIFKSDWIKGKKNPRVRGFFKKPLNEVDLRTALANC